MITLLSLGSSRMTSPDPWEPHPESTKIIMNTKIARRLNDPLRLDLFIIGSLLDYKHLLDRMDDTPFFMGS
jgi:hypothetical protein